MTSDSVDDTAVGHQADFDAAGFTLDPNGANEAWGNLSGYWGVGNMGGIGCSTI